MPTTVEQVLARKGSQCWSVDSTASVQDAVAVLSERKIGAVLVCDNGRLLGVLSERDCIRQVMWQKRSASDTRVSEVMIRDVVCVTPSDSIDYCMSLMNDHRIRHLPVVSDGQIMGLISIGDAVNATLREKQFLIEELEGYITGPASIRPSAH
jgi:signal-transduction protein with cAMP-binding, CBS, and nucleotidyltransferase domain